MRRQPTGHNDGFVRDQPKINGNQPGGSCNREMEVSQRETTRRTDRQTNRQKRRERQTWIKRLKQPDRDKQIER